MDKFLRKYSDKYDKWFSDGTIDFSSKVIPIAESLDSRQWVIPTEQALSILGGASSFALTPCVCRTHYNCDKPREMCFFLNETADQAVSKGMARRIDLEEAKNVIETADENGLVHMSLYKPDREVFALCNCCKCCCHDLQLLIKHGRNDLIAHSDFVAETESESCSHCGVCIERCAFNARFWEDDGTVAFNLKACHGCGLCITTCPEEAISMEISG